MTIFRFKADPDTGDLAIYSVPDHASTDNDPLYNPYDHPDRLQFHSGMVAPSTTDALTQTHTITIPAQAANTKYSGQINLFEHGKGEPCMVEGGFWDPDTDDFVAFNGTMPINVTATGHAIWLALCATDTHVALVYFGITPPGGSFSDLDIDIEASAYDFLVSGAADTSDPELPLMKHVKNEYLQIGRGKIDTRRRYLRSVATGGDFALATTPTLTIIGAGLTVLGSYVQNETGWRWRYSCNGYVKQTTQAWNGGTVNGGGYDAEIIRVKR